ncbi:hypothetical protein H4F17_12735 [Vibrio cholerae]
MRTKAMLTCIAFSSIVLSMELTLLRDAHPDFFELSCQHTDSNIVWLLTTYQKVPEDTTLHVETNSQMKFSISRNSSTKVVLDTNQKRFKMTLKDRTDIFFSIQASSTEAIQALCNEASYSEEY